MIYLKALWTVAQQMRPPLSTSRFVTKPWKEENLSFKGLQAPVEELLAQEDRVRFQISNFGQGEMLCLIEDVTTWKAVSWSFRFFTILKITNLVVLQ